MGFLILRSAGSQGGGGGGVSVSRVSGVNNIDSGLGGSGVLYLSWTRPTTNADASACHDLKTFKVYVGTGAGGSQLVNALEFAAQPNVSKRPRRCRITGLNIGTTYYCRVTAVDSEGNESAASNEVSGAAAAAASYPSGTTDITAAGTISSSGNYRLANDITGNVTINANNVTLRGNGFRITHNSGHGVTINAGVQNFWADAIDFSRTSGTGSHFWFAGTPGTGTKISRCTGMTVRDNATAIDGVGDPCNLNGALIFSNAKCVIQNSGFSEYYAFTSACSNFTAWDNEGEMNNTGGRSAMFGNCQSAEIFENRWSLLGNTIGAHFYTGFGCATCDIHDNELSIAGTTTTLRPINIEGPSGQGTDGDIVHEVTWNRWSFAAGGSYDGIGCIRIRGAVGPVHVAHEQFGSWANAGGFFAINLGDSDSGGEVGECPFGAYLHDLVATNYGSSRLIGWYGGAAWKVRPVFTWRTDLGGQTDGGGGGQSSDWSSWQDNLINGVSKIGSGVWRQNGSTIGGTNPFTPIVSPDYDPRDDTPSAPVLSLVTGVP